MIEILKKMFDAGPEKSTLVLKDKCSGCGCETTVVITPTSEGFGLQGGVLFKCSPDGFLVKCPLCHPVNLKADDHQKNGKKFIKILLVEDDLSSKRVLNTFLSPIGDVDVAVNGNEAISAVENALDYNQPYDLIFLDTMLPGSGGIEILKKIRELETQRGVNESIRAKIIMTSANTDKDMILKAARADCSSFIFKPIDKFRLYNEIRNNGFDVLE
ncbi:MAG: response regulator [Deltaproteobacteria bacterium]|nr:response regulator [Deltaproteobacteria bacterium]